MMASRLELSLARHPGSDDHLEDEGGVIGAINTAKNCHNEKNILHDEQKPTNPYRPQSSSASHVTAGAFGFLTFT
jgi:hypothetical protein